jgi:hypothetical protein
VQFGELGLGEPGEFPLRIFDQIGLVHLGVDAVFDGFPEGELDRLRIDGRD